MSTIVSLDDLKSESDVEQKLIMPLLVADSPHGFGIPLSRISTKAHNKRFTIGKGAEKRKSYFPDYIVAIDGYPLAVVEAKERGADIDEAFREARLYANELNAEYGASLDPVGVVVASNGDEFHLGVPNSSAPLIQARFDDLTSYSTVLADLQNSLGYEALLQAHKRITAIVRPSILWKPRKLVGGQAVQDEAMPRNTFGATLSDKLLQLFNPTTREERARVVREAYVTSHTRSRYVQPIDSLIRASAPPSHSSTKLIEDLGKPTSLVETLQAGRELEHKVVILVGGAGAGKSTFVDYLQEIALPQDLRDATVWVRLNMNLAPVSNNEIYDWLRKRIVTSLEESHKVIDFAELDTLKAVYSVEVNRFNKGRGALFSGASYNTELAQELKELQSDAHRTAVAYCRYCGGDRGKLLVFVLDNCDKRTRDEQLLMFQAAQWLRSEFRGLVILPLREETYDNHRDEPPLDTALKDLAFRIEPPPFHSVLAKRVQLALNDMGKSTTKSLRYELANSMHVDYAASDQAHYLVAIVASVFQNDRTVSRLLLGLSGQDLRRAFEVFLEICNSGHIPESEILKIKNSNGAYTLPVHVVMRVLLRQNRRYYDGDKSYVKNIIQTNDAGEDGNAFCRLIILKWLSAHANRQGGSHLKGYSQVQNLVEELGMYPFSQEVIYREITYLAKAHCIITEDFRTDNIGASTLVRLGATGLVHLELLGNLDYWAAMAEDSLFDNKALADRIASRIGDQKAQYTRVTTFFNAHETIEYFNARRDRLFETSAFLDKKDAIASVEFSEASGLVAAEAKELGYTAWFSAPAAYPEGTVVNVVLQREMEYGFFVDFPIGVSGLLLKATLPRTLDRTKLKQGAHVDVRIIKVEPFARKVHLEFVGMSDEVA